MAKLKNVLLAMSGGAFLGYALASLIVRSVLPWYNSPGGNTQALCNCSEVARGTASAFLQAQLTGMAIGAVVALVLALVLGRRRKPSADVVTSSPAAKP